MDLHHGEPPPQFRSRLTTRENRTDPSRVETEKSFHLLHIDDRAPQCVVPVILFWSEMEHIFKGTSIISKAKGSDNLVI